MKRPLCPILTIGFNPPEEGQRDLRRCHKECALYDGQEDTCAIQACLESIRMLNTSIETIPEMMYECMFYQDEDEAQN